MKKFLLIATVQSHIAQFHKPLINMLKDSGIEVHVAAKDNLYLKGTLDLKEADKIYDIEFHRSPFSFKNIKAFKELKKIINSNNYSTIYCNTPVGGLIGRLASKRKRKLGTEVIYMAH